MRIFILVSAAVASLSAPALAHPEGHEEPVRSERRPVSELAQDAVVKLITQGKLPASWSKATQTKRDLRSRNGKQPWVVTFLNKSEPRRAKRTLYVLMTPDGEFISANHRPS